jgi:hypothetical protein
MVVMSTTIGGAFVEVDKIHMGKCPCYVIKIISEMVQNPHQFF